MILCLAAVMRRASHSYISDRIGFSALRDPPSVVRGSLGTEGGKTSRSPNLWISSLNICITVFLRTLDEVPLRFCNVLTLACGLMYETFLRANEPLKQLCRTGTSYSIHRRRRIRWAAKKLRESLSLAHFVTIKVRGYEDECTQERAGSCLPETRKLSCSARSAPALPPCTPSRGEPCCAWTETSRGSTARRSSADPGACPTHAASDSEPVHK
jgi:hypothetical protein